MVHEQERDPNWRSKHELSHHLWVVWENFQKLSSCASMSLPSNFDFIHIIIRLTLRVWALGGKNGEEGGSGMDGGGMGGKEKGVGKIDGDYRGIYIYISADTALYVLSQQHCYKT